MGSTLGYGSEGSRGGESEKSGCGAVIVEALGGLSELSAVGMKSLSLYAPQAVLFEAAMFSPVQSIRIEG